jgi:hypothetical protein
VEMGEREAVNIRSCVASGALAASDSFPNALWSEKERSPSKPAISPRSCTRGRKILQHRLYKIRETKIGTPRKTQPFLATSNTDPLPFARPQRFLALRPSPRRFYFDSQAMPAHVSFSSELVDISRTDAVHSPTAHHSTLGSACVSLFSLSSFLSFRRTGISQDFNRRGPTLFGGARCHFNGCSPLGLHPCH